MTDVVEMTSRPYREDFVCWASNTGEDYPYDHDHPGDCDWGWCCNQPGCCNRTDIYPCTDHAPVAFPGLRLVECQATPRHWLFAHDRDDYGHGCPWCWANQIGAKYAHVSLCPHKWWQRWRPAKWGLHHIARLGCRLGLALGYGWQHGDGCHGCFTIRWRWTR